MRQLVVGAGEVGAALAKVLFDAGDVAVRDLAPSGLDGPFDVLHICFPWSPWFAAQVAGYQSEHGAGLVIVHSTVPVGTCDPRGWVHSPVRGRHPHLVDGLRTFVKHAGGTRAAEAAKLFVAAGMTVAEHPRAAETEAGKLWELTQLGLQVKICQAIHDWCAEHGLDADVVYDDFADTYNAGYAELGEGQFVRPVLEHIPGPIGGHCVRPNAALLDHPLAAWVAE